MRSAYKNLCFTIAGLVVLQAGFIAWAFFGMSDWITNDNGVVNKELLECEDDCDQNFFAEWGFAFHMFFVGTLLIPLLSLITLLVSFFSKVPGAPKWAGGIVLLVILQVFVLPGLAREVNPIFGALHGINALVLMGVALMAAKRAGVGTPTASDVPAAA